MFKFKESTNQKLEKEINKILDRMAESDEPPETGQWPKEVEMVTTSETVKDTLDTEGNPTGSVIEKKQELPPNDVEQLTNLVAVKNDHNRQKNETIQNLSKAGLSLAGIMALLIFEQDHTITSRVGSFIPKPKI